MRKNNKITKTSVFISLSFPPPSPWGGLRYNYLDALLEKQYNKGSKRNFIN